MHARGAVKLPSIPALALYAATVAVEIPVMFARMLITLVIGVLLLLLSGHSTSGAQSVLIDLGMLPSTWAVFALVTPAGGAWWWQQNLGGRAPSEREELAYQDALDLLEHQAQEPLREPSIWFVLDTPQPDAAVCGNALMVSRGLLEGEHLPAVLAHELGHLASSDGKLTAALNRLVVHPPTKTAEREPRQQGELVVLGPDRMTQTLLAFRVLSWIVRKLFAFAKGGLGLLVTAPAWGAYWREREYVADQYAVRLGQAEELADFLEIHALIHDHPVPFIWLTEHTHPPTELRIDRLRKASFQPLAVAPGSEPVKVAPAGPPAAWPDGPTLTEPDPSAGESLRSAGMALPTCSQTQHGKDDGR